jgi:hypothetical protein
MQDKMRIHSGDQAIIGAGCEDYFYNYFKLGLDILFDMRTHVVKKFILHTNFPCHNDFNVYVVSLARALFLLIQHSPSLEPCAHACDGFAQIQQV